MRRATGLALALLAACAVLPRREEPITRRWPVMGTFVEVSLWGEGRYLVEVFGGGIDLVRVDSFVLDAKDRPELTRLTPRLGSP